MASSKAHKTYLDYLEESDLGPAHPTTPNNGEMLTIELFSSGKELPNDPNDEIEKQLTPSGFGSNGNPDTTV